MYSIVETGGFQYKVELGKAYKLPNYKNVFYC